VDASDALPDAGDAERDLADLAIETGPFLSLVLTTDAATPNAQQVDEVRWRSLRSELVDGGVPEDVLVEVDGLVPDAHLDARTLGVIANAGGVLHVEHGEDPTDHDDHAEVRREQLPWLFPILSWRRWQLPHLVVLIDRRGADLTGVRREGSEVRRGVDSEQEPQPRSKPGGWSQRRYQQRAENSWEQGAGDVAKEVVRLAERVDPRLIVVAGDVRAVGFLREALPPELDELVHVVEGERERDGGAGGTTEDVSEIVIDAVRQEEGRLLARFEEELGQGDLGVEGAEATVTALTKAQVDVLLIRDDVDDDRRAWIGPDPTQIAMTRGELDAMGVDAPIEARLRDAIVRATLGTSARIHVLDADMGPREGIGALLRWSDASTG
jgi:hypothetical protein